MTRKFSLLKLGCKRESSQTERKSHARGHRSKRQPRQNGTNSVSDGLIPAIGDEPSVSNAQLPAHQAKDDQSAHASWDSPDAPVTLLKPRCSGFEDYKSRLQLRHRCTVVACNDRGAQCVAVATAEERAAGIIMHVSVPCELPARLPEFPSAGVRHVLLCRTPSLNMACVCHSHSMRRPIHQYHSIASSYALVARCGFRYRLYRAWASLQGHVLQARPT